VKQEKKNTFPRFLRVSENYKRTIRKGISFAQDETKGDCRDGRMTGYIIVIDSGNDRKFIIMHERIAFGKTVYQKRRIHPFSNGFLESAIIPGTYGRSG
jgi:hypothetical protein